MYYKKAMISLDDTALLNRIRDIWQRYPFYGYRRITRQLKSENLVVNKKRVQRLMREHNIKALYPKPNTSKGNKSHAVYPYLLSKLDIDKPDQAWQVDITYLRHGQGFMYLVVLIDVYSRFVVGWSLSNTLDTSSCIDALETSTVSRCPDIINSDQGCQFTSDAWISAVNGIGSKIRMTGKGRCLDNIYIERFWRSFKQEEFYLNDYTSVAELTSAIERYIHFYNNERWHQSLDYKRPRDLYLGKEQSSVDMQSSSFSACSASPVDCSQAQ